jgi:hypothetical protein
MATTITPWSEYEGGTLARQQVGLWRDGLRRLRRNRLALAAIHLPRSCSPASAWSRSSGPRTTPT